MTGVGLIHGRFCMIVANDPTVKGYKFFYSEEHTIQSLLKNTSEPNKSHLKITFHVFTLSIQEELTFQDKVTFSQQKGILVESFTIWLKCPQEEFLKSHLF